MYIFAFCTSHFRYIQNKRCMAWQWNCSSVGLVKTGCEFDTKQYCCQVSTWTSDYM